MKDYKNNKDTLGLEKEAKSASQKIKQMKKVSSQIRLELAQQNLVRVSDIKLDEQVKAMEYGVTAPTNNRTNNQCMGSCMSLVISHWFIFWPIFFLDLPQLFVAI